MRGAGVEEMQLEMKIIKICCEKEEGYGLRM